MQQHPPIEPTTFDLIVVGTGLPQSVIAAAASSAGKTVLHIDPNHFYGGHFSSLTVHDLTSFLENPPSPPAADAASSPDYVTVSLTTRSLYSHVEVSNLAPEELEQHSRKFILDVSGPRVIFCADKSIELLLKSGASHCLEFKSVEASFVYDNGRLASVPDSRAAIFKDKSLRLTEKNQLMRFFKLIQEHLSSAGSEAETDSLGPGSCSKISGEDLDSPFVDFLNKMRLPPKIKSIIIYAIAMSDYDQDNKEVRKYLIKTRDAIDRLALYNSSLGRFPNALGALIYPMYGQGELPQAFSRRAAVKGCLYVLRMPISAFLLDKESRHYRGVKLASGQDLFSNMLVLDPSFTAPSPVVPSPIGSLQEGLKNFCLNNVEQKVARGICITRSSLKPDLSNLLVVYPPKSLFPEQVTSIRVLQISGSSGVCPLGMFVLYISSLCDDANQGKKLLQAAMNSLVVLPDDGSTEHDSSAESESTEVKPTVLWSASYIQELSMSHFDTISSAPMPDGNLSYDDTLDATVKLFEKMYPDEPLFPETSPGVPDDDEELSEVLE